MEKRSSDGDNESAMASTYDKIKKHSGLLFPLANTAYDELFSESAKEVVNQLLESRPAHRPTAEKVLASPWISNE